MSPTPEAWMTWPEFMQLCHNSRPLPFEVLVEIEDVQRMLAELELLTGGEEALKFGLNVYRGAR